LPNNINTNSENKNYKKKTTKTKRKSRGKRKKRLTKAQKKKRIIVGSSILTAIILLAAITYFSFIKDKGEDIAGLSIKIDSNWSEDSNTGVLKLYKNSKKSTGNTIVNINLADYDGTLTYEVIAQKDNFTMVQIESDTYGTPWIYIGEGNGEVNGTGYTFIRHAEFPDLTWMGPPKHYKEGRSYNIIWNVIHSTDGTEDNDSAENGATYDKRREETASVHFYHDPDSSVQTLFTTNTAYAALYVANERGVHHELCGLASQTRDEWLDKNSKAIIDNAAKTSAYVSLKYDIPIKWLNDEEIENREKGFITHADITRVIEGTHTDPGEGFPKDYFLERVNYWVESITAE
jgi:hypothetical protein